MKRLLSLCLAMLICLSMTACQPALSDASQTTTVVTTTTSASTVTTAVTTTTTTTTTTTVTTTAIATTKATTTTTAPSTTTTVAVTTTTTTTTTTATTVPPTTTTAPITTTTAKRISTITPALYAVKKSATGSTVWLFGSIHIGTEEMYPLPDYVLDAFNGADCLAVECDITDITEVERNNALMRFAYSDRSTIDEHISARLYADARDILKENNDYNVYLNYYKPSLWSDLINSYRGYGPDIHSDFGVDLHLINLAKEKQKQVVEIESFESQNAISANFSPALQEQLLEEAVLAYYSPEDSSSKELLDLWKKGDVTALREWLSPSVSENNSPEMQTLLDEYQKAMYTKRDQKMFDFAFNKLFEFNKNTFICVGAAHIVGENGLLDRFENSDSFGITITRVTE